MKKLLLLLVLLVALALPGCSGGGGSSNCNFSGLVANAAYLVVIYNPSTGITSTYTRYATWSGTLTISTSAGCFNVTLVQIINSNLTLSANPSTIDLNNPPATVTITGQYFDTTYGMPRVEYFDSNGFLVGSTLASSVSGGGTSLVTNVPNLQYVYSGAYTIRVTNKTYLGHYSHIVGTATITAFGRDRLDSDGDGYYDDQDCDPWNPYLNTDCSGGGGGTCGGGNEPVMVCNEV